ncbi:PREDICTED: regulator of G-protein signaling loco [Nicrophorus vespilloides]|uniref:Regulator of G-protein signaling loco n=1 Tax=Nicrophorus vespilloides TaxID=110193 RepID=A0ABM1MKW6_NICVS|nr:PREDICTED: regulator of G-protein signaling loco [Nicrophorus vespilloides]
MHPNRRRKKRPNYGIRTVEVMRGPNGFGFTISGQQPCILSCIVSNSPADQAGLRAGDFLISVNGVSVSKITHDAVVNLIGNSIGPIKMTIAENYYSDSSDEDITVGRMVNSRKPKYLGKPRMHRGYKHEVHKKVPKKDDNYEDVACSLPVSNPMEEEGGPIEYKAIVGYLGTIEMPKQLLPNSRLQTVCGCIKKLRQEKRKPTTVLMTILPTCLTLKNSSNNILAIYPTNRVVYISSSMDKDSRYFGLVTSAVCENVQKKCETSYTNVWNSEKKCNNDEKGAIEVSNSCHVFVTDPKYIDHNLHTKEAENFRISCTNDVITGYCLEFPRNALYIVSLVQNMYRLQSTVEPHRIVEELVANSPQPSASSNSDSGIGFRDDCGNVSDRILVVEFPANRQIQVVPNNTNRPINIIASNIQLDSLDLPPMNNDANLNNVRAKLNNIRACENLSIKNAIDRDYLAKQNNEDDLGRLNCRVLGGRCEGDVDTGQVFSERGIDVPLEEDFDNVSMHSSKSAEVFKVPEVCKKRSSKRRNLGTSFDNVADKYETSLLNYKLSPKVYGMAKPNYSCEELSKLEIAEKCGGSLQDLAYLEGAIESRRFVAQSEPDVRIERNGRISCEDNETIKTPVGGPTNWAVSFEKLLECPAGLHTFAEFLKKEFSAENIYFWTACERFRKSPSAPEAQRIYQQHLRVGAPEAVNVDSQARQNVEQGLKRVTADAFLAAQKQIFNLMKFDSYSRFLKSELYKQCMHGKSLQWQFDPNLLLHPGGGKLKKSLSNAEDRRRKSLLPWHRKNRSKSKDRGEIEYQKQGDVNENIVGPHQVVANKNTEVSSSRSSLTSLDLAISSNDSKKSNQDEQPGGGRALCRVNLVNGSSTVVQIRESETIEQLVHRLLEKRGIVYSCFDVQTNKHPKGLNVNLQSTMLVGCEVNVEQKVHFKLSLPNKTISVKCKCSKILSDVLQPLLLKYNYNFQDVCVSSGSKPVDCKRSVIHFDNATLSIAIPEQSVPEVKLARDELTNKVYEDILQEKSEATKQKSDKDSVKSEDWGSEHSGLIGRFLKPRDSERNRDKKKKLAGKSKGSTNSSVEDVANSDQLKKPLITKLNPGVKIQNTSESEELYEGLSRAQRSRLEDQRGTEINFELPDFLKDKENDGKRVKQEKKAMNGNYENRMIIGDYSNNNRVNNFCVYPIFQEEAEGSPRPPPLPPKPKIAPKSLNNWNPKLRKDCSKGYLEQATSSFV